MQGGRGAGRSPKGGTMTPEGATAGKKRESGGKAVADGQSVRDGARRNERTCSAVEGVKKDKKTEVRGRRLKKARPPAAKRSITKERALPLGGGAEREVQQGYGKEVKNGRTQ